MFLGRQKKSSLKKPLRCEEGNWASPDVDFRSDPCRDPACSFLSVDRTTSSANVETPRTETHEGHGHDMPFNGQSMSIVKASCLFAALSFHSVIEGIGLGSAVHAEILLSVSVAILAHKGLAAFALGSALCRSKGISSGRMTLLALIFALGTPLGAVLGLVITREFGGPATGICLACAAGTFFQVSTMELVPSALQPSTVCDRRLRCMSIIAAFLLFSLLALWA